MSRARLTASRNVARPDHMYAMSIDAHHGLSQPESEALNVRLIVPLINHIGDAEVIGRALALARRG